MANEEQLALLRAGVEGWNKWRKEIIAQTPIDLSGADLRGEGVNYHELLLRRDGDRRSDVTVKREMLAGIDRNKILFAVEDRSRVVEIWRSEGLVCL